jgi:tRNA A37 threonylcarbamoyladenosine modification protein TsaB
MLEKEYCDERPTSDCLPLIIKEIAEQYEIKQIAYARGPGSFMAIKVTYVTLSTLSLIKDIPFVGSDGFAFNNNSPIKAIGKKYFVKVGDEIVLRDEQMCDEPHPLHLPLVWDEKVYSSTNEPLYVLPAL